MKKITAREIALSGIACAFSTILLTVGAYVPFLLITAYLFSSVALMIPLARKSYAGYVFAYVGSVVLALIFSGFNFFDLLPFAFFFGLHPLVNELQLKTKINVWVACLCKAIWFDVTAYGIWRFVFAMTTAIPFVDQWIIPIILVVGTAFFIFYDILAYKCRMLVNVTVQKLDKKK